MQGYQNLAAVPAPKKIVKVAVKLLTILEYREAQAWAAMGAIFSQSSAWKEPAQTMAHVPPLRVFDSASSVAPLTKGGHFLQAFGRHAVTGMETPSAIRGHS